MMSSILDRPAIDSEVCPTADKYCHLKQEPRIPPSIDAIIPDRNRENASAVMNPVEINLMTKSPNHLKDDESVAAHEISDGLEAQECGKTRSATRRQASQSKKENGDTSQAKQSDPSSRETRGSKRKRRIPGGGDSDSDHDEGNDRSKCKLEAKTNEDAPVCSCPKDVMTCIGILPSLPIVADFYESDDSSLEDLSYTVLPTVCRSRRGNGAGHQEI